MLSKYLVLAVRKNESHLTVAMTDPTDLQLLQDLAARTSYIIDPVIATSEDILEHIDLSYRLTQSIKVDDVRHDREARHQLEDGARLLWKVIWT